MAVTFNTTLNNAPTGTLFIWSGIAAPTGYLFCDGSFLSRTTYAKLFNILCTSKGTFTVTIASPAVITLVGHGLNTGDCISLSTTGALPTNLVADTNYYVIRIDADTIRLATTYALAIATVPTPINTTGTQSGVHSLLYNPWGISGASNFLLPDSLGAFPRGVGTSTKFTANKTIGLGHYGDDTVQGHKHSYRAVSLTISGGGVAMIYPSGADTNTTGNMIGPPVTDTVNGTPRTGNETAGKSFGTNFIIKY